ncbi:hypothetical protein [Christiangramia crocea]|uniref:Uncharacterized protein n=1 Tax=Christiangramia crocea TaxID=2904124 RepID=A0A9X2A7E4_9FLAO|nr:hypothetical protein [Gramella crocea]MCG9973214.1 hypothetical protein [Gramella crocea]
MTRTIDGNEITRNEEKRNRTLYTRQKDGSKILKLNIEVEKSDEVFPDSQVVTF